MKLSSLYPVMMTSEVHRLKAFYCENFGFTVAFEAEWYVSLKKVQGASVFELALLEAVHDTIPMGFREQARGIILNFEVQNAGQEYERLVERAGIRAVLPLKDEAFGQRHFMIKDPAGNLIDIIENIPPSGQFASNYAQDG
jgi:uncharacterized glyoxalase superfamily protein PhnB